VLKTLATLAVSTIVVGALAFGVTTLVGSDLQTRWVNWGGESFSSPSDLRSWLRARGLSYRAWAKNHPLAAARLEGRAEPRPARISVTRDEPKAPPSAAAPAGAEPPDRHGSGRSVADRAILLLLVLIGASLVALAALPVFLLRAINVPDLVDEHRFEFATAGASIAIGMAAAQLLSG
jgi:hypothetical protein